MKIQKKPVFQELRAAMEGEVIVSTSGPQTVPALHAVIVGSPTDSWPVAFSYLLENTEPADPEAERFYEHMRGKVASS